MNTHAVVKKIQSYLKELTIVILGVLIALIISNYKENRQARKYHIASIETVKNEVESNYATLNSVIENQSRLQDTITKYSKAPITLKELFQKANGLESATLSNAGLEFYSKNAINLIDFEMMSTLISMNTLSELIDIKMEKLLDFVYLNPLVDSEESKLILITHLTNIIQSETQLMLSYQDFIDEYITTKNKSE